MPARTGGPRLSWLEVVSLEAVAKLDPQEMHDLVGAGVLDERSGEKDFVGRHDVELAAEPVGQRGLELCSDESRVGVEPRSDHVAGHVVNSVVRAVTPVEHRGQFESGLAGKFKSE